MGKQKTPAQNATREVEAYLESLLVGGGRPSEIAEAFAELGDAQLRLGAHAQALESFAFCLSYSSPKMQATAYLGLAKTRFAIAKKQPKSKRAKTRDEALAALESALKLTKRFHADSPLEADVARLHEAVQALPFKVSV